MQTLRQQKAYQTKTEQRTAVHLRLRPSIYRLAQNAAARQGVSIAYTIERAIEALYQIRTGEEK